MMFFPSPDWFGASAADARNGLRSIPSSWIEGPAALRWRFGHPHHARIVAQSRWRAEIYLSRHFNLVLRRFGPMLMGYLKMFLGLFFHEGIHHVSNENQKPVAPGTTKVEPVIAQPAPQQHQGDAKPNTDKPAVQQK
jgi:hypothetical protein